MAEHIFEILAMLFGAALLGFFIGWLFRKDKTDDLQEYITALEMKNNRLQDDLNKSERTLIDCQTEKRKAEAEKKEIEKRLVECEGRLTLSEVERAKDKIEQKEKQEKSASKKAAKPKPKQKTKTDNLTKIEGIGPKIASILTDSGISSFTELSKTDPEKIRSLLLEKGGKRYSMHNPETWPEQAKLAAEEKWDELKKIQEELKGGKKQ